MTTFRTKPDKIKHVSEIKTLDESHRNVVSKFKKRKEMLPKIKAKLAKLQKGLTDLEQRDMGTYTNKDIIDRATLKGEISKVNDEIEDIESNTSEIDYYSQTDELLMDYYDIVQHGNPIVHPGEVEPVIKSNPSDNKELTLLDKLNLINKKKGANKAKKVCRKKRFTGDGGITTTTAANTAATANNPNSIFQYFNIESKDEDKEKSLIDKNRAELFDQYIMLTDSSRYFNKIVTNKMNKCIDCGKDMILIRSDGIIVCEDCGIWDSVIIEAETSGYADGGAGICSGTEGKTYPYKRKNHFSEFSLF